MTSFNSHLTLKNNNNVEVGKNFTTYKKKKTAQKEKFKLVTHHAAKKYTALTVDKQIKAT